MAEEPLIKAAEAARQIGINRSGLCRQIKAGSVRSHDGLVRLSEVIADRGANIEEPRGKRTTAVARTADATIGATTALGTAKTNKEVMLGNLRALEYEQKAGRLVDRATVERRVFELARASRDGWANWPSQAGPLIAHELGVGDIAKTIIVLEKYVREHLLERSQPTLRLAG